MTDRIRVGVVAKAHGLKGEVVVRTMTDLVDERFAAGATVFLDDEEHRIVAARRHKGDVLVVFDGLEDRNAAELLRGRTITVDVGTARDASDVYFADELVGMTVADDDGNVLGTVSDLIDLPAVAGYDLLEVTSADGTTWLLPNADDLVEVATDPTDETHYLMVVDPPEGLLP